MIKAGTLHILIIVSAIIFAIPFAGADDSGNFGSFHEYAPYSFWISAASFIDDPAMEEAYQAIAEAAHAMGKTCYDGDAVKEFMADMMSTSFDAVAINRRKTFTYYDADGSIRMICKYRYLGTEVVEWGGYPIKWHKYKRASCIPSPRKSHKRCRRNPYKYFVSTDVHQDGEGGMIHGHARFGNTSFDDLLTNPDYSMWWPTLAIYGATTAESMAQDQLAEPSHLAGMLPECLLDETD